MSSELKAKVSVIVPVLNEARFIESMVTSILSKGYISKEILLVDGGSTDQSKQVIESLILNYPEVVYIENKHKFVSHGFNRAFPISSGKYIAFLGAHALYPDNFFDLAVHLLSTEVCDAVGGPLNQIGRTERGKAIAYSMSHPIGVGNTEFRTLRKKMYVDSLAFAVYKREVFEKIGLLDTDLIRNQDDEFHYRMNASGMKILMVPELECTYYVRDSFTLLFKQYYEYGLYKPLVIKKVKEGMRLRHLIPSVFVLYLLSLPVLLFVSLWFQLPLLIYFLMMLTPSVKYKRPLLEKGYVLFALFTLHISYGLGFLRGLIRLV